ncbi:MAG TPA: lysylphosphatidylglycerol synthase transmembrane domain-containing protein [Rhodothermales bacterium]|nr:lysylphosphatidylglycerol synthase transmembrane domain-containing protein [Rhodothermales bacterium]
MQTTPPDVPPAAPPARRPALLDRRRLVRAALLLIPLGVAGNLALTLATTDREVLAALPSLRLEPLLVAGALALVPWVTNAFRVQIWMGFVGLPVSFREALRVYIASALTSALTPTASGGGVIKWALLTRRGLSPGTATTLLVVETVEDVLFFALTLPVAFVLSAAEARPILRVAAAGLRHDAVAAVPVLVGLALASVLVVQFALRGLLGKKTRRWSRRRYARLRRGLRRARRDARAAFGLILRRGKARFALSMLVTAVQWTARYSVALAVLAYLGAPSSPVLYWVLQWATFMLMGLVPTPGATGGAEAAFLLLYSPFVPGALLGLATATWRLVVFYLPMGLAAVVFPFLAVRRTRKGTGTAPGLTGRSGPDGR